MWIERVRVVARTYHRPMLFVMVGAFNTLAGYGLFALLFTLTGRHLLSLVIATILGIVLNYFTTGGIVFKNRSLKNFWPFVIMYSTILLCNMAMLELLVHVGVHPLLAQAICLPVTVVLSYLLSSRVIFRLRT